MPQHPGFEPTTRIWVVQVYVKQPVSPFVSTSGLSKGQTVSWILHLKVMGSQADYDSFKAFLSTSNDVAVAKDYGQQLWRNKRRFIVDQFNDVYINGNWIPDYNP
jgi:hypothetical protein